MRHSIPRNSCLSAILYFMIIMGIIGVPDFRLFAVYIYSKTSVARTLMARLPRLFRTSS